ncbi:FAD-binding oxidoreductase [Microbacterium croceum]|nr:FAD-linked oxidase C-terminal domain-containing protein [Microbacterium croceum]
MWDAQGSAGNADGGAQELIDALERVVPGRVLWHAADTSEYSHDRSHHGWAPATAVVRATSTEEVAAAVQVCRAARVPVIARGTGTGLEGGANAVPGAVEPATGIAAQRSRAVIIDLRGMNRILRIDPDSADATVEAGVLRSELNPVLAVHGLQFVAGPGVDASIGGMAATRASGTNAVKYGTMAENVRGLTVVMADGAVVKTGGRARKSSAGYDLTHLFIGSEGTLGIITELTLKLAPTPEGRTLTVLSFPSVDAAARVVQRCLQAGVDLARAELLDTAQIAAINAYSHTDFREASTLFVELSGEARSLEGQAARLDAIADAQGLLERRRIDPADQERVWQVRHDALPAAQALRPDSYTWSTDVCVPIAHLAQCITETQADIESSGLLAPIAGHVGDGNFHLAFVLANGDDAERQRAAALYRRMIRRALSFGGTCTGEHGIGEGKMSDLIDEHPTGVPVMRAIKRALDPEGLLNPGKMVDLRGD